MDNLLEARKKAEAAVDGMQEGDLRTKAFEVILQHLLSENVRENSKVVVPARGTTARKGKVHARRVTPATGLPMSSPDRVLTLKDEGFFESGRGIREIRDELQAHGWMYKLSAISGPLMKLVRQRQLRRAQFSDGKKKIFRYFNP
jgi:hypothetical protein